MPMHFEDFDSLRTAARVHKFREPYPHEDEASFRLRLASHVLERDFIESLEIQFKRYPPDQFPEEPLHYHMHICACSRIIFGCMCDDPQARHACSRCLVLFLRNSEATDQERRELCE